MSWINRSRFVPDKGLVALNAILLLPGQAKRRQPLVGLRPNGKNAIMLLVEMDSAVLDAIQVSRIAYLQ